MFRSLLAIVVAFAITLFSTAPTVAAQSGWPSASQSQSGQYPGVAQDSAQQMPDGTAQPGLDSNGQGNPQQDAISDQQHGVARISVAQGDVNVKRGDTGELVAAAANAPLVTQDRLQTADGSRAEIELDYANLVRLAPNTDVGLADVEYHRYQLQLGAGTIVYRVLRNSDAQVEVDTPSVGFRPLSEGEFRISVMGDGTVQITARSGRAEIFGPRGSQQVPAGQTILVRGSAADPEFRNTYELARDQFDDWSAQRDSELLRSQSYNYVSPDIAGADDLDRYGNWVPSQYGQVWAPQSEPAGWSPYSTGEWAWQDYYGWSWVDSAPWGWAPYHYGRWFYNGGYGWCWWPGAVHSSYFWSPALVGFFGWGGFGVGLALGGLGWVALAPFEAFHRWWGPGWYGRGGYGFGGRGWYGGYGNFARNVDIARTYRNATYRGGAMTAAYNGFGGPHQRFAPATRGQLTGASAFRGGQMPLAPGRGSYAFSGRGAVANPRLASVSNQRFFGSSQFRSQSLRSVPNAATNRTAGGYGGNHGVPPNISSNYAVRSGSQSASRSSAGGWQRFGDPGNGGALRQNFSSGTAEGSGWHSFGQPQRSFGNSPYSSGSSSYSSGSPYSSGSRTNAAPYRYNAPASSPRSYAPAAGGASRYSSPSYTAPRNGAPSYSSPSYNSQHYSAPSSRPGTEHFSAPSGGGSHGSGGGFSHGGGGHSGGSGGGHSGGGGGGHHR